jgi:hypothetical protein
MFTLITNRKKHLKSSRFFDESSLTYPLQISRKGVFNDIRIRSRTRDWPAYVKCHAADDNSFEFLFSTGCEAVLTIVTTIRCVRPALSKMGTEVVGTLTHADTRQRGKAPHLA